MIQFFNEISQILARDPGNRGLMRFLPEPDLAPLYEELNNVKRALIVTGFPIRLADGRVFCETDGPIGAADMAAALMQCGATCAVVTDQTSFAQVRAAMDWRAPAARTYLLSEGVRAAKRIVDEFAPTHVLPIERPGKAGDGHCRSLRGAVIDDLLTDTDGLYAYARDKGAVTIAIGDGGNELGTGIHRAAVSRLVPGGAAIAAAQDADYTLMAGVSNWWGWGIAALVSVRVGCDLLPSEAQTLELMRAVLDAGAVDGVTKLSEMTVDNLSIEENLAVLEALRAAYENEFARRA